MMHNSVSVEIAAVVLLVILLQQLIQDENPENKWALVLMNENIRLQCTQF